jgi:hypothetical protein
VYSFPWHEAVKNLIANARRLLAFAGEAESAENIERVILSIPRCDAELRDNAILQRSYCVKCLARAQDALPGNYHESLEQLAAYFNDQLPNLNKRQRGTLEIAVGVLRGLQG